MVMFAALKAVRLLRLSKDGELVGMDLDQHGVNAYPEYVISALGTPDVGGGEVRVSGGAIGGVELAGSK
jgi:hypothetical protein